MKTSFYFVLWILIYPLLALFHNQFIIQNSFLIALIVVWGLAWVLARVMPQTIRYVRISETAPILEDVYNGNVEAFSRRLSRRVTLETISALYFGLTTIVAVVTIFKYGGNDWLVLVIFGFLTIGAFTGLARFTKAKARLRANPVPEECVEIAQDTLQLDYASYYETRNQYTYRDILAQQPRHFKIYQIASLIFAAAAAVLGTFYIIMGVSAIILSATQLQSGLGALVGIYILYGALAAYYGIRDIISTSRSFRRTK